MTLDLKKILLQLDGSPLKASPAPDAKDATFGEALANILLSNKVDPLRSYTLAQQVYKDDTIELTPADADYVKTAIKTTQTGYTSLVLGQLLVEFK